MGERSFLYFIILAISLKSYSLKLTIFIPNTYSIGANKTVKLLKEYKVSQISSGGSGFKVATSLLI